MKSGKIIMKKGITRFCVKARSGQELSEREAFEINENRVPGFLDFSVERSGSGFTLTYDLSGLLSLREFLQFNVLSERMLKKLLESIFENLEIASRLVFNRKLIQMTVDTVLVNPANWRACFIYVPIQPYEADGNLNDLLKEIVTYSTFDPYENTAYVQRYIEILNDGLNFSEFAVREFVSTLSDKSQTAYEMQAVEAHEVFEPEVYVPRRETVQSDCGIFDPYEAVAASDSETTASGPSGYCLLRKCDGTKTRIDSDVFHIGKVSRHSDLFINNRAVSRQHADIIREDDAYYIMDLGSTNGTFVNGVKLQSGEKVRLSSRCELVFANDEFVFYKD